jgi:hypothetical protein
MLVGELGVVVDEPSGHHEVASHLVGVLLRERLQLDARRLVEIRRPDVVRDLRLLAARPRFVPVGGTVVPRSAVVARPRRVPAPVAGSAHHGAAGVPGAGSPRALPGAVGAVAPNRAVGTRGAVSAGGVTRTAVAAFTAWSIGAAVVLVGHARPLSVAETTTRPSSLKMASS